MRRAAWIFFASIFLPSLGLAWLAIHSVRDQQVVLEHQQAIICQDITDALAKSIQDQMDQVRADFVKTTAQLLDEKASPQTLALNFNRTLRDAWPAAEIGFAVNLNGEIYSPTPYEGPEARTFRDENERFLSNRENVEVYSSNSTQMTQNAAPPQNALFGMNAAAQFSLKLPAQISNSNAGINNSSNFQAGAMADKTKKDAEDLQAQSIDQLKAPQQQKQAEGASAMREIHAAQAPVTDRGAADASMATGSATNAPTDETAAPAAATAGTPLNRAKSVPAPAAPAAAAPQLDTAISGAITAVPVAATDATTQAPGGTDQPISSTTVTTAVPALPAGGEAETMSVPSSTVVNAPPTAPIAMTGGILDVPSETPDSGGSNIITKIARNVIPQQILARDSAALSNTVPEESDFRRVIGTETSGELARFLEDKMRLLVWMHPSANAPIVFGAQLDQDKLVDTLKSSLQIRALVQTSWDSFSRSRSSDSEFCAAILDDTGHPVALSVPGFNADWKHPFVATEIGEVLPHWEAALYLVDPQQFSRAARTLQLTFLLIVLLLVAASLSGGSLIARDVRREMRLAQQKTDFVSNVSHELKTPLTSIRMFADLLAEKRVPDEERQATYLRIIAAEASRLTRLINNVLDFARLEKGAPHGEHAACDLVDAARDVADTCGPHLEAAGIAFQCEVEAESLPIRGDRDALAQIILNLISNAEKYGGNDVLVRVRRQEVPTGALGCVDVLDRGAGIPARQVKTIFEPFHRLDDSLSSGIPGSGLGLTLARRMARAHGGDVTYSARAGGGSCFTLAVPLV
jgi:signal transduction histidine kinase